MNENNDCTELKLRDLPTKPIELQNQEQSPELKLQDKPVHQPAEAKKEEPLVQEENIASKKVEQEETVQAEEKGSAIKIIFQVVIMLAAIAAIIVAGYSIYKQLSPESSGMPQKKDTGKTDKADQKKTDKGQPAPKAAKIAKIDANKAEKGAILKTFADLKMVSDDASKLADEVISGRPYNSLDELKGKYKDDKAKSAIIGKAFNNFGEKPKAKIPAKSDKESKPPVEQGKSPEPAKPADLTPPVTAKE